MTAQYEAQTTARTATITNKLAMETMAAAGAVILKKIRSTAASTNDELVYTLAAIPLPAEPSPIGAPGTPDTLETTLKPDGSLLLKWDCQHPHGSTGTVYQVYRRSGDGPLVYLGPVGAKRFIDQNIPKGATMLMYTIQAVRSTKVGQAAIFAVKFGSNGETLLPFAVKPMHAVATSLAA